VEIRFIEGRAVVVAYTDEVEGPASGLETGDVILTLDGKPLDELVAAWRPYYSASNEATLMNDICRNLSRGPCGDSVVEVERDGRQEKLTVNRTTVPRPNWIERDRPGDTFQLLSDEVAYLKLSSVTIADVPGYLDQAVGTKGLVVDIRNYPGEFVVFALGMRLITEETPFARFTVCDPANPGAFVWGKSLSLHPQAPAYEGQVVILVNEASISQAEYTAMALRAGPNAMVVGSTTKGADGNVSQIPLPGGLKLMITGIGVFYPDKTPTQRVGIVPDVFVTPTIAGTVEGRDEVLEEALRQILGEAADEETIRGMAQRP
jgi:C-terminal processing protease CtpA/Prc